MQHRTWVEINTNAINQNIKNYHKVLPKGTKIMSVVKANAYGHGLSISSEAAIKSGVDYLSVFTMDDAIIIRKKHKTIPILVLKQIDIFDLDRAIKNNIDVTVSSIDILKKVFLYKGKKKLRMHLKLDTGLSRQGFLINEIDFVIGILKVSKNINLVGLYTHFTGAESKKFNNYTKSQVEEFLTWAKALEVAGYKPILHTSATSGALLIPELSFDMVRLGIGMYGLWPSVEIKNMSEKKLKLNPVLSWKTVISEIKTIAPNTGIAYEATHMTKNKTKVAILPVGYWDGLPRSTSNNIDVLIHGARCRVLGRIMMNMCIVDISKVKNIKVGDEVVIIGKQGREVITADELAMCAGTINYEIVTRINPEIPRIAIN